MKKGDIRISYVIGGVVAVFVLVAVIYFLANSGGNLSKYIDWIIPRKNETKGGVAGIEIFRYDIAGGNAGHYDGTKWMAFEEITVGGKKVNAGSLKKDFESYYFGEREKIVALLDTRLTDILTAINYYNKNLIDEDAINYNLERVKLRNIDKLSLINFNIFRYAEKKDAGNINAGDVEFLLVKSEDIGEGPGIRFILNQNNRLKISYYKDSSTNYEIKEILSYKGSTILTNIFSIMEKWRDGVFEKPIFVNYIKKEGKEEKSCSGEYSAALKDDRYIVVDLGKRIGGEKC